MKLSKIQVAKAVVRQDGLPEPAVMECLTNNSLYNAEEMTYWFPDRNQKLDYRLLYQLSRFNFLVVAFGADIANIKMLSMVGAIEIARFANFGSEMSNMRVDVVADIGSDAFTKQRRYGLKSYHSVSETANDIYWKIRGENKAHLSKMIEEASNLFGSRLVQHVCDSGIQAALRKTVKQD